VIPPPIIEALERAEQRAEGLTLDRHDVRALVTYIEELEDDARSWALESCGTPA
jgi:hypothetical protein